MIPLPVSMSHSQTRAPTGQQITAITTITRNLQQQSALSLEGEDWLQALPAGSTASKSPVGLLQAPARAHERVGPIILKWQGLSAVQSFQWLSRGMTSMPGMTKPCRGEVLCMPGYQDTLSQDRGGKKGAQQLTWGANLKAHCMAEPRQTCCLCSARLACIVSMSQLSNRGCWARLG